MQGDRPREPRRDEPRDPERPREGAPAQQQQRDDRKPTDWEAAERKRRASLYARFVVGLTLLVLFVVFVSLNSDSVPVHFIFVETRTPLVWVFLVCALIGGLVAYLLGRTGRRSSRKYIKQLERRLEERGGKR